MGTAQTSHKKSIAMDLMNYVFYVFVIFCCALKHPVILDKITEIIIFKKRNIKMNVTWHIFYTQSIFNKLKLKRHCITGMTPFKLSLRNVIYLSIVAVTDGLCCALEIPYLW